MEHGPTSPVDPQYRPLEVEERVLAFWERSDAFNKLRQQRADRPEFRFLDGPITANNPMGVHHAWGRTLKDAFIRFHAMRNESCRYQNGYDCQGLWVEVEVERALGFRGKPDIEAYGLDAFSRACRDRVNKYAKVIADQSVRLGQWMDWEHSYYTHDDGNIAGIWTFLKKCHERSYLYQGHMPLPWCTRCGTSLSQHEMMGSYVRAVQPAIYVTAPLCDGSGRHLLMWTTTPWTLAANTAAAVHPDLKYVEVKSPLGHLIMSEASRRRLGYSDSTVTGTLSGDKLVGLTFETFFPDLPAQSGIMHRIVGWDEIDSEEGAGIVHIAPGCGPEDFVLAKENDLGVIAPIDDRGRYVRGFGWLEGQDSSEVTESVITRLRDAGRLLHEEMYEHSVPVCWRCKSHVVFRLVDEWFISAEEVRQPMIDAAAEVKWQPAYMAKRMEDWLRNMGDWNISRKRFWGLPLPFYPCTGCDTLTVVGSVAELRELACEPEVVDGLPELHRPWIDEVKIKCPSCAHSVSRVPEVGDCWLDAGITPYSTLGYFDDRDAWTRHYPAEWICEMREQIRLWFYSMLFMGVVLDDRAPYERVLSYERVVSEAGEMFSKTGFMIRFDEAVSRMGADSIRYIFCRQPVASECRFGYEAGADARRRLAVLWNIQSFFLTYAQIDLPTIVDPRDLADDLHVTDRWLLARTERMLAVATEAMLGYNSTAVISEIEQYLDEVSNWYVRVNRRRLWTGQDPDKQACYATLFAALRTVTLVLAPLVPFITEEVWQNAIRPFSAGVAESVHLELWPSGQPTWYDDQVLVRTAAVRAVVRAALRLRADSGLRVRQPLRALYIVGDDAVRQAVEEQLNVVASELNVKQIVFLEDLSVIEEESLTLDFRLAGPVLRTESAAIAERVKGIEGSERTAAISAIRRNEPVRLSGWTIDLPPEIFVFERRPRAGFIFGERRSGQPVVALDARIDDELVDEGTARDLIRQIQVLRRDSQFEVSRRIALGLFTGDPDMQRAIDRFWGMIAREVLADEALPELAEEAVVKKVFMLRGKEVVIEIRPLSLS
ncbi:MAG: isoleucine--tRNA ligase [Pseudonocardiaceae bacterium]